MHRTALESPAIDLPQWDKERLLVMSVGGSDLFGPNAKKVQEWKKDTKEEKVKLISRVFEEREHREKASKKSSSTCTPHSLAHQSTLGALPSPRSQDSYRRPPGQSFRKDSSNQKQSSYKHRQTSSSKGHFQPKDRKTSSQSNYRSGGGGQSSSRKDKDKRSQQPRPFNHSKKGRGGGGSQRH